MSGKWLYIIAYTTFQHKVLWGNTTSVMFYFLVHFTLLSLLQLVEWMYIIEIFSISLTGRQLKRRLINLVWLAVNCCRNSADLTEKSSFGGIGNLGFIRIISLITLNSCIKVLLGTILFGSSTVSDWLRLSFINSRSNMEYFITQASTEMRPKKRTRSWKVLSCSL